jgi:Histidine kinase
MTEARGNRQTRSGEGKAKAGFSVPVLKTRLRAALRQVAAGDAERERGERDLHDGVQQRLSALGVRLALAAETFKAQGDDGASDALAGFGDEVEETSEELCEFAQRVYRSQLTWGGLNVAFDALRRSPESVMMLTGGLEGYSREIETAVYFSCLAAMDNAAQHGGPAEVTVRVWNGAEGLRFTIGDTGRGFDSLPTPTAAGIANMRDRLAAVGGALTVDSTPRLEPSWRETCRTPRSKCDSRGHGRRGPSGLHRSGQRRSVTGYEGQPQQRPDRLAPARRRGLRCRCGGWSRSSPGGGRVRPGSCGRMAARGVRGFRARGGAVIGEQVAIGRTSGWPGDLAWMARHLRRRSRRPARSRGIDAQAADLAATPWSSRRTPNSPGEPLELFGR